MLLHLLLLLAHKRSSATAGSKRQRKTGQVVLECPHCGALGVAQQFTVEEATGLQARGWQVVRENFQCGACRREMNAESFENDGTGVMKVRTWACDACQAVNPATSFVCLQCRRRVV